MTQLPASEVPLHKVFSSDYHFKIPDYQRPYAWEQDQAGQLLDDVVESMARSADEPYFLGSLILVKQAGVASADVIDGQQRLTTLTILFAVLRDLTAVHELQTELSDFIRERGSLSQGLKPEPRLALRPKDRQFFATHVQVPGAIGGLLELKPDSLKTDAQKAIQANARLFWEQLSDWDDGDRLALVQRLSTQTWLVVVSTPDLDSAHRIFSVMNARGLDLSPTDIFKAQLIGDLPDDQSAAYAERWENAEEDLGRTGFVELFIHLRMLVAKTRAKRELLKEFPEQVLSKYTPGNKTEFIDDLLLPYAAALETINSQQYEATAGAEAVNQWLRRLGQLDNSDWRPPAMWALRHHADDPAWLDAFLRHLERLAAAMFICRTYTTPRAQRYIDLLGQLDEGAGLDAPAFSLSQNERAETITRLSGDLYLESKTRKYVLLRLDEMLANTSGATYQHGLITVEHVLPQHPAQGSQWLEWFTDDERATWTHRLANLVLLNRAKNAEAQNYEFELKKQKYFTGKAGTSNFALTSQVLNHTVWAPTELEARQLQLLQTLRAGWRLSDDDA